MSLPLARAFGLAACSHKRNGGNFVGPDYKILDHIESMRKNDGG